MKKEIRSEIKWWRNIDSEGKGDVRVESPNRKKERELFGSMVVNPRSICNKSNNEGLSRFTKDFNDVFSEVDGLCKGKVKYLGLYYICKGLELLNKREEDKERMLLLNLWDILHGDQYSGIYKHNLFLSLYVILHRCDPYNHSHIQNTPHQQIGTFDLNANYSLTNQDKINLHRKFYLFYLNRHKANQFKTKLKINYSKATNNSTQFFEGKKLDFTLSGTQPSDFIRDVYLEHKNMTTSKISGMKKELGPRWRNLFKLSKFQRKGDGRTSEEIEMQRNSEEYSFRPKITSYKKFEKEEVKGFNDKVIADFAARMQKVRDEKERIEKATCRGEISIGRCSKFNKGFRKRKKKAGKTRKELMESSSLEGKEQNEYLGGEDPLIIIQVKLGGDQEERIEIFDLNQHPQTLAKLFSKKHNLDSIIENKLTILIEEQISQLII